MLGLTLNVINVDDLVLKLINIYSENKMKKVSLILPVHNSQQYLEECLQSINDQIYKNFALIIVDDGSKDNSIKIIESFIESTKISVKFIKNTVSKGVSVSRNLGLSVVDTPFVTFMDSDDIISPFHILNLVRGINSNDVVLSITSVTRNINKLDKVRSNRFIYDCDKAMIDILGWRDIQGFVFNKLFRMSIIKENGINFKDNIHISEDLLFVVSYFSFCDKFRASFNKNKTYFYRINKNSVTHKKISTDLMKKQLEEQLVVYSEIELIIKKRKISNAVITKFYEDYLILINNIKFKERKNGLMINGKNNYKQYTSLKDKYLLKTLLDISIPVKTRFIFLIRLILNKRVI